MTAKDRAHAIDILEHLIQGGSKTHQPVGHDTRDVVVADAVDHERPTDFVINTDHLPHSQGDLS